MNHQLHTLARALPSVVAAWAVVSASAWPPARGQSLGDEKRGLEIAFVDVEGGAATLVVTPAGESILFDSGWPGDRDADRIAAEAKRLGVTRIDHYVVTHWHLDHVGGSPDIAKRLPIGQAYGHRIPDPLPDDIRPELIAGWRAVTGQPVFLEVGDGLALKGTRGAPNPKLRILAADGLVPGEKAGAPQVRPCEDGQEAKPEDASDNARSLAWHLSYGPFDLFSGGDLTWNVEHKLTCPDRPVKNVDVYLVNHHGSDSSNHPALVKQLAPSAAIVNNGPRKGGEPRSVGLLLGQLGEVGVFQLHRAERPGAVNTEPGRIANDREDCKGHPVRLHVNHLGTSYVVDVPSRATERRFDSKG